jgi:TIR domain
MKKIFLGWSGDASRFVAEKFRDWLPLVLQGSQPWISTEDIGKGALWQPDIAQALQPPAAGIFVLTRAALTSSWMIFEAGALSSTAGERAVVPYLIDIERLDPTSPWAMFQSATAERTDTLRMLHRLNRLSSEPMTKELLERLYTTFWPELESAIAEARALKPRARRAAR